MEDNNKQDLQSSNPENNLPQGNGQQSNNENTYWEANITENTIDQHQAYQNYLKQADQQPDNPSSQQQAGQQQYDQQQYDQQQYDQQQFDQQVDQQQYNQQQYNQPIYSNPGYPTGGFPQTPKKKSHGILVAVIVILLLLGVGAGTAYAFKDTLMNTYAKATKSPAEYYAFVEGKTVSEGVDAITPYMDYISQKPKNTIAYDLSSNVTVNKEALDSLLQTSLGVSFTDLEAQIGIPLDNIGFDTLVGTDGSFINETFELSLNQVKVISSELFFDTAAEKILVRFPELSDAYLSLSNESSGSTDKASLNLLTKERTADLLKNYSNIVIDNINQVTMEKTSAITVGTITKDCTELAVTITEKDLNNMAVEILETAKEDQYIIDLLPMLNMTVDDYKANIDEALAEVKASETSQTDTSFVMTVYVDSKGNIIGREISTPTSSTGFGYTILTDNGHDEYMAYAKDETGATIFEINGNQTEDNGAYDGKATIAINGTNEYTSGFSLDLSYTDVRTEKKNNVTYQYGSIIISSLELMGMQVTLDYNVENEIQTSKLVFQLGADPLVTVDSKMEYLKDYQPVSPPADAEVYDINQTESYAATIDLEGYLTDLSNKLGIDLQGIFNSLFGSSYY